MTDDGPETHRRTQRQDDEAMLRAEYERLLERREFWHGEYEARQDS
jgi:hypothetical protein